MSEQDRLIYWQRRARDAERLADYAERERERMYEWTAREVLPRERQLSDRCTYLYGLAARHGATDDELRGPS